MLDEGVKIATYKNLVGVGLHIQTMDQIADESYEHLVVATDTTRLSIVVHGKHVHYDF